MSIDATSGDDNGGEGATGERGEHFTCGVCSGTAVAAEARFLAAYPTDDAVGLAPTARDGLLALCGDCSAEVDELTDAWNGCDQPAVASAATIAVAYRDSADECSFCESAVGDGSVLGLDDWSGTAIDGDAIHYALCESCVPIFTEFLAGIAPE